MPMYKIWLVRSSRSVLFLRAFRQALPRGHLASIYDWVIYLALSPEQAFVSCLSLWPFQLENECFVILSIVQLLIIQGWTIYRSLSLGVKGNQRTDKKAIRFLKVNNKPVQCNDPYVLDCQLSMISNRSWAAWLSSISSISNQKRLVEIVRCMSGLSPILVQQRLSRSFVLCNHYYTLKWCCNKTSQLAQTPLHVLLYSFIHFILKTV